MWFQKKQVFITGTDTDVGKTWVSLQILKEMRERTEKVGYFKPFASGGHHVRGKLVCPDVSFIRQHIPIIENDVQINPYLCEMPLSPNIAGRLEKKRLDETKVQKGLEYWRKNYEYLVVEGAGGVLVPITDEKLVIDYIADFRLPTIVVSRPDLGTINHTLLTLDSLRSRDIEVLGIVFNQARDIPISDFEKESFKTIEKIGKIPILGIFEYDKEWAS